MIAAQQGQSRAAEIMLEAGVFVDLLNNRGYTALHWAVRGGHEATVRVLLAAGADPRLIDVVKSAGILCTRL